MQANLNYNSSTYVKKITLFQSYRMTLVRGYMQKWVSKSLFTIKTKHANVYSKVVLFRSVLLNLFYIQLYQLFLTLFLYFNLQFGMECLVELTSFNMHKFTICFYNCLESTHSTHSRCFVGSWTFIPVWGSEHSCVSETLAN